jgi:hypothetical protein
MQGHQLTPRLRTIARWSCLSLCVAYGLLQLYGALLSAWMSGGPPNPYPQGWGRRAEAQLLFAIAAFAAGWFLFRFITSYPSIGKACWALALVAATCAVTPTVARHVLTDSCLDHGGQWSNEALACLGESRDG